MSETEMYNNLKTIWENLTIDGDRTIYIKMLVLLDNMRYFLHNDLQLDYTKEIYEECAKIKPSSFDF